MLSFYAYGYFPDGTAVTTPGARDSPVSTEHSVAYVVVKDVRLRSEWDDIRAERSSRYYLVVSSERELCHEIFKKYVCLSVCLSVCLCVCVSVTLFSLFQNIGTT